MSRTNRFAVGRSKTGGRKKGTPNRISGEARTLARELIGDLDYQIALRSRLRTGRAGAIETLIWAYAFGKPTQPVAMVEAEAEEPLDLSVLSDQEVRQLHDILDAAQSRGRSEIA